MCKNWLSYVVIKHAYSSKIQAVQRSSDHISWLEKKHHNVSGITIDLTQIFESYSVSLPSQVQDDLSMANLRSRIRMSNLYVFASNYQYLVVGTGNKVEDFGVGFYKYGDGGVIFPQ